MITYHNYKIKSKLLEIDSESKLQDFYDATVNDINRFAIGCVNSCSGNHIIHGYYFRRVKLPFGFFRLRIMRLKCKDCGVTHAILLSDLVPYTSIPLAVQVEIIRKQNNKDGLKSILDCHPEIFECEIYNVVLRYRNHWQERLKTFRTSLGNIENLVVSCFSNYLVQFMQIRMTPNILYTFNHIA